MLSAKREKLIKRVRQEQIEAFMEKVRYQMVETDRNQSLADLIDQTQKSITPIQLEWLIEYVNADFTNAIIHLGNLIIDGIVDFTVLANVQWKFGKQMHWIWLIKVFTKHKMCSNAMFQHAMSKLINRKNPFEIELALYVLKRMMVINQFQAMRYVYENKLLQSSLIILAGKIDIEICSLAYEVISMFISFNDQSSQKIIDTVGAKSVFQIILSGLLKKQINIRVVSVEMAHNLMLIGVYSHQITDRINTIASRQKQKVKLQISFYWTELTLKYGIKQLIELIGKQFIYKLDEFARIKSQNDQYDEQIRENALKSAVTMAQRLEKEYGQKIYYILKQMDDLHLLDQQEFSEKIQEQTAHFDS